MKFSSVASIYVIVLRPMLMDIGLGPSLGPRLGPTKGPLG